MSNPSYAPSPIGQKFGRLTALSRKGKTEWGEATWNCVCDCGETAIVRGKNLRAGTTSSCGCYQREIRAVIGIKHGMKGSREYSSWIAMRRRCNVESDKDYPKYGARGVSVCAEWNNSFDAFYSHVGPRPEGTTLDRIDGSLGYSPGNVRWATALVQGGNRRNIVFVTTSDGSRLRISEVARQLSITVGAAHMRLKRGKLHV